MREGYAKKLSPGFLEAASAYKELVQARVSLGKNPPSELIEKINKRSQDRLKAARTMFPDTVDVRMGELFWLGSDSSESEGLLCWLCLLKYRKPLWKLIYEVTRGDPDSCEKWAKLCKQWKAYAEGREPFPSRFKIDLEHYQIFLMGISCGIQNLSHSELAEFFDDYCPVCMDGNVHDVRALSQQRARFMKDLQSWEPANEEEMALFKRLLSGDVDIPPRSR